MKTEDEIREVIRPSWQDRPTSPGLWMVALYQVSHWTRTPTKYETWSVATPAQFDAPAMFEQQHWGQRWYGPISPPINDDGKAE